MPGPSILKMKISTVKINNPRSSLPVPCQQLVEKLPCYARPHGLDNEVRIFLQRYIYEFHFSRDDTGMWLYIRPDIRVAIGHAVM